MKEIARGAEAVIYLDKGRVIKKRLKKSYRHPELDAELRKARTKREVKLLSSSPVKAPKLLLATKDTIEMEYLAGKPLVKALDQNPKLAKEIGANLAKLHDKDIIHGDLTTSNMILTNSTLAFIDFGLSFTSKKVEDKAVDIHLFKQALESKHYKVEKEAYKYFLQGYKQSRQSKTVLERLAQVELRGRYKTKT